MISILLYWCKKTGGNALHINKGIIAKMITFKIVLQEKNHCKH
jgi:hypothetical protein